MLDWPADTSTASPDLIKILDYGLDGPLVSGLPTGLMVSGFLANVAMLDTDVSLDKKTKREQIAHFRYVDDHIILSHNFRKLIDWISKYSALLEANSTGGKINFGKTKPEGIGRYLENKFAGGKEQSVSETEAREICRLDPKYPTPLITTTVAKVSALAGENIELLDSFEKMKMLSDLEHLMLADFAENELPSATRAAFASSRISSLVPTISQEQSNSPELGAHSKETNSPRTPSQIKAYRQSESFGSLDNPRIANRAFKLLLHAVSSHPDKLLLWRRLIDFCQNVGHTEVKTIWNTIGSISKDNIDTKNWLQRFIIQCITDSIFRATKIIRSPDDYRPSKISSSLRFMESVITFKDKDFFTENINYEQLSIPEQIFQVSALEYSLELCDFSKRYNIAKFDVKATIENQFDHKKEINKLARYINESKGSGIDSILFLVESRVVGIGSPKSSALWKHLSSLITVHTKTFGTLFKMYPKHIPNFYIQKILGDSNKKWQEDTDWLVSVFPHLTSTMKDEILSLSNQKSKFKNVYSKHKSGITLTEWVDLLARDYFPPEDPRSSEWSALEIAIQICDIFTSIETTSLDDEPVLCSSNFIIPNRWISATSIFEDSNTLTWEEWRSSARSEKIGIAPKDRRVREFSHYSEWNEDPVKPKSKLIRSIASIVIALLHKDFSLTWAWSVPGLSYFHIPLLGSRINALECSSWTSVILESCLFSRSDETFLLDLFQPKNRIRRDDDTEIDPPHIGNISELKKLLLKSQEVLEKNQISVRDSSPRQIIPIIIGSTKREMWSDT